MLGGPMTGAVNLSSIFITTLPKVIRETLPHTAPLLGITDGRSKILPTTARKPPTMDRPLTPLYQDTVLLHLGSAATRLSDSDVVPAHLPQLASQVFETGHAIATAILDAPDFFQETVRWSLEHVDQITSLWAHDTEVG